MSKPVVFGDRECTIGPSDVVKLLRRKGAHLTSLRATQEPVSRFDPKSWRTIYGPGPNVTYTAEFVLPAASVGPDGWGLHHDRVHKELSGARPARSVRLRAAPRAAGERSRKGRS